VAEYGINLFIRLYQKAAVSENEFRSGQCSAPTAPIAPRKTVTLHRRNDFAKTRFNDAGVRLSLRYG